MKGNMKSGTMPMPAMKSGAMPSKGKDMGKGNHPMPSAKQMEQMHKSMGK